MLPIDHAALGLSPAFTTEIDTYLAFHVIIAEAQVILFSLIAQRAILS